jgi:hypothetical protein
MVPTQSPLAMIASAALPPAFMISTPMSLHCPTSVATPPFFPESGGSEVDRLLRVGDALAKTETSENIASQLRARVK